VIKSGRMRWEAHVARMEERSSVYRIMVGKSEGSFPQISSPKSLEDLGIEKRII
jgi:hypothetical protein